MTKRDIFSELIEGFDALKQAQFGKTTLKTTSAEYKPPLSITLGKVRQIRTKLNVSRPVSAQQLRTETRTIAN